MLGRRGKKNLDFACIICHRATGGGEKSCSSGTKPGYYIVLRRSPIIAGLMQVEIMAIISPAGVGDAGVFVSKSLCEEVDGSHLVNYRKLRAGYHALLSSVSHLNLRRLLPNALVLLFSPSHKPVYRCLCLLCLTPPCVCSETSY